MKNNNTPQTNFWFGFAFGAIAIGGLGYLVGTSKGRNVLKKILETAENYNGDINPIIKEITKELSNKLEDLSFNQETENKELPVEEPHQDKPTGTLNSVLNRIKTLSPLNQKKGI